MNGGGKMKKSNIVDNIGIVLVIIEIVFRVICSNMEVPDWTIYVTAVLLLLIIVCIVLHFVFKSIEKKQGNST